MLYLQGTFENHLNILFNLCFCQQSTQVHSVVCSILFAQLQKTYLIAKVSATNSTKKTESLPPVRPVRKKAESLPPVRQVGKKPESLPPVRPVTENTESLPPVRQVRKKTESLPLVRLVTNMVQILAVMILHYRDYISDDRRVNHKFRVPRNHRRKSDRQRSGAKAKSLDRGKGKVRRSRI